MIKMALDYSNNSVEILIVGLFTLLFLKYIVYHWNRRNLYFLASKIRGPKWLPIIGSLYVFGGPKDFVNCLMKLDKSFPRLIKLWAGQRLVFIVTDPKYLEIILNSPKAFAKAEYVYRFTQILVGDGLITAPVHKWKRNRKIINPTFNMKILEGFVKIFANQSDILTKTLEKFSGNGEFDVLNVVNRCTLDIICETTMGVSVNAQTSNSKYLQWVDRMMHIIFTRMTRIWYHPDFIFNMTTMGKEQLDIANNIHQFSRRIITRKRKHYEDGTKPKHTKLTEDENNTDGTHKKKAFLDLLIELSDDGAKFTDEELQNEIDTFIMAGSDTTAVTSCFCITLLGMHLDVQKKVYDEVIEVVGPTKMLDHADLPNLKYTEMVVKETLRLFPSAALALRSISDDIDLGDTILPGRSSALICSLLVHRNPNYWPNPLKFDPDRFLPEESAKRIACSYIPFTSGPRSCIGQRYAIMSMKVIVTNVVRKFKIFSSYKSVEEIELETDILIRPTKGFKVCIEFR